MDDVLTVEQVAALAKLKPWTVRRMLREGTLAGGRTSDRDKGQWRIARSALDAWLHAPSALRSENV